MADKYLILIREPEWNPENTSEGDWASMSTAHKEFSEAVIAAGAQVVGGEALQPTSVGTNITPAKDGNPAVFTDGPFTETKEVISGFYLLEVENEAKARELAALCPTGGWVEFRPVFEFTA